MTSTTDQNTDETTPWGLFPIGSPVEWKGIAGSVVGRWIEWVVFQSDDGQVMRLPLNSLRPARQEPADSARPRGARAGAAAKR